MKTALLASIVAAALCLAYAPAARAADSTPAPAAAASTAASPDASAAPKVVRRLDLLTSLKPTDRMSSVGGELLLRVMDDGSIRGTYTYEGGNVRAVVGTLKGKDVNLDIGTTGNFRIIGTMDADGSINANTTYGTRAYTFTAVPRS
jgi:hypothetical protein